MFFFFSSRRRHTRYWRDWSSDVCSSDLINDFYHLGTKNTIKSALYRLNQEKQITRLIDGLYTKPEYSEILKEYSYPDVSEVAEKIADKFSWTIDRKSTRLNSSHANISYAVFCLKKKKNTVLC